MIFVGELRVLEATFTYLSAQMILKRRALLGWEDHDDKHIAILNRLVSFEVVGNKQRITYEPDPRHAELIVQSFGLQGKTTKGVSSTLARSRRDLDPVRCVSAT